MMACGWYAMMYNMKRPSGLKIPWQFIMAVAYHETGGFTSNVWRKASNGFGMRPAVTWKQWRVGIYGSNGAGGGGYASYVTPWESVRDYMTWCDMHNLSWVSGGYWIEQMQEAGYFEASFEGYWNGVQSAYEKCEKLVNPWWFVVPTVLAVAFYAVYKRKNLCSWINKKMNKWKNK